MGGPGSGGRRPGSGSKPKGWSALEGGALPTSAASVAPVTVVMPGDLTAEEQAIWQELAPLATARQTLNAATALGFAVLCRNVVLERRLARDVEKAGGTDHRGIGQAVARDLLRFDLSPNGKPHSASAVTVEQPKSALELLKERRANLQAV